ncbi:MAG: type II CRISPR RNA-guided endonuclease Cas9 [Lentilactobacillus diolivorans]|uniref:type II CRISPR RNA-guided endonuclease Cas9 n=1 Tax=Lentilactobacillus diolivorans TaxID=179838 RepID=UPI0039EC5F1C
MRENYHIGLDIGTSSIGWAVIDDNAKVMRAKGKTAIGARLFNEGQTAADRRLFRTTRRRLNRRKWRLKLLDEIFDPYITPVDATFFARLKQSNLSPKDQNRDWTGSMLFPDRTDRKFHENYPTIYHLRHQLMTEDRKFDIREIYLAIHHIVKYRGNFLNNTPVSLFSVSDVKFGEQFDRLNELYAAVSPDEPFAINGDNSKAIETLLLNDETKKFDKQKQSAKLILSETGDKALDKENTKVATQISKAILGYKTQLDVLLKYDAVNSSAWKVELDDENIDDTLPGLLSQLDENRQEMVSIIQNLYAQVTLNQIVPNGMSLSESMIEKYNDHRDHLKLFKQLEDRIDDPKKKKGLEAAYDAYVGKDVKVANQDVFYASVKKNLDDSDLSKQIADLIEAQKFMPKQRTSQNGVIPHQLHQLELDQIIENQSKYYPWLAAANPNPKRIHQAKYKLDELVAFRIPYYVGPLVTPEEQEKSASQVFAWMKRKQPGTITPWNFDQKVDRMASANRFIRRMTTKDTYLIGEDVLPDASLIYERFKVLNELNLVKANYHRLAPAQKQAVYRDLFENQKSISTRKLQNYLVDQGYFTAKPKITGLSDPERFNSSLGTYIDFKEIFGDQVDNPDRQDDYEKIIEWSTVFEDRQIYEAKLRTLEWLTEDQIQALKTKRYNGWGRLSKKLLTGIVDENGERIIDVLWNTNQNFMQVQSQESFAKRIHEANAKQMKVTGVEDILADAYTSPQNKKAIRQVIRVVDDIQKAMGGVAPTSVSIEFTRSEDQNPRRTQSRESQLQNTFKADAKQIVDSDLVTELETVSKSKKGLTDRLYLYFTQLGKDMYTGEPLNIDELSTYDIDHILPQAFIKDDSLDNRVLVSKAVNNGKSNNVPVKLFGGKMGGFWKELADHRLISKRKLKHLLTDPDTIDKYTMRGFIRRQLVETSQVIKLVAQILGDKYQNDDTRIIEVTAKMNHQMRENFKLIKNREVNDYHHAVDAYLTAFVGQYLYKRYPKLRPYFVYGNFKKFNEDHVSFRYFNFLHELMDENNKRIVEPETGEVVLEREPAIAYMKRVYHFKFMLISQEVYTRRDAMFNQTIYPAKEANRRKLIAIKQGKTVDVYGGYSGSVDAYMAIARIHDKKGDKYKVVGVPVRALGTLNTAHDKEDYDAKLKQILVPKFTKVKKSRKTGEITKKVEDFEIVLGKVMYRQLVIDGDKKFMLGSSTYLYNAKQLVLSDDSLMTLASKGSLNSDEDSRELISMYDEILKKANTYFELYDINKFRSKLVSGRTRFVNLPNHDEIQGNKKISSGKKELINEILNGLHANATFGNLKEIGISTPFGKMQVPNGISLSENTIVCYQSPTGLFEHRVSLKDL